MASKPQFGAAEPQHSARSAYRLASSAEKKDDGTLKLSFRLLDEEDGIIIWTRLVDSVRLRGREIAEEMNIVQQLAPMIAQPYGVMYSRELSKGPAGTSDPRYRCVIGAFEFYRSHDSTQGARVQDLSDRHS